MGLFMKGDKEGVGWKLLGWGRRRQAWTWRVDCGQGCPEGPSKLSSSFYTWVTVSKACRVLGALFVNRASANVYCP